MEVSLRSHAFLFEQVVDTLPHLRSCTTGRLTSTVAAVPEAFPVANLSRNVGIKGDSQQIPELSLVMSDQHQQPPQVMQE